MPFCCSAFSSLSAVNHACPLNVYVLCICFLTECIFVRKNGILIAVELSKIGWSNGMPGSGYRRAENDILDYYQRTSVSFPAQIVEPNQEA